MAVAEEFLAEDAPITGVIKNVLLVDDSRVQRRIIAASLKNFGFEITEAESGQEAMEICNNNPPDLVLSDWMMPGMNGLEFCQAFRKLSRDHYGYFILLTSKAEKKEVAKGLDAGADDFLTKPVNSVELRARISAGERILKMERSLTEKNTLVENTLAELRSVYDGINKDLLEAKNFQQSLISERHREFSTANVSLMLRSSGHVGGDLVGMFEISPDNLGIYSIDVSGHGISSALMTARLAGYLSSTAPEQNVALTHISDGFYEMRPPSEVISHLNQLLLDEIETEHYFTIALADVDLISGHVALSQAGHPHPIVQRKDNTYELIGKGGLPVGLIEGADYQQVEFKLDPGDRLIVHSDGIVECADRKEQLLGDDGFGELLCKLQQTHGPGLLDQIIAELTDFAGHDNFDDDVSAVLLEFKDRTMI